MPVDEYGLPKFGLAGAKSQLDNIAADLRDKILESKGGSKDYKLKMAITLHTVFNAVAGDQLAFKVKFMNVDSNTEL